MLTVLILSCVVMVVKGQVITLEDQVPDTLQMYRVLDERAENIAQIARELGAAVDALRSGRTREFLKNAMSAPSASNPESAAEIVSTASIVSPSGTAGGITRFKRSYYGGSRRYGGGYGGYGRSYGGYSMYGRGGYGGYGYGRYG